MIAKQFCCPHCDEEHSIDIDARVVICSCRQVTILHDKEINLGHASCVQCEDFDFELTKTMGRINMYFQYLGDEFVARDTRNYVMEQLRLLSNSIRKKGD